MSPIWIGKRLVKAEFFVYRSNKRDDCAPSPLGLWPLWHLKEGLWNYFFYIFFTKYLHSSEIMSIFANDSMSSQGWRGLTYWKKDVYERYLQLSTTQLETFLDKGTMRRPRRRDKREVMTPTSFILTKTIKPKLGRTIAIRELPMI